jgi:uncharacterized protein YuzE
MKIIYHIKDDAVHIEFAKGKYEVNRKISDSVIVDEDKDGKVLGIEILGELVDYDKEVDFFCEQRDIHNKNFTISRRHFFVGRFFVGSMIN